MSIKDLVYGWAEMEKALPGYCRAEDMFTGKVAEVFASERIRAILERTGEAYRFNLIKTPVTVRASRCEITAVKVPGENAATERISEVWKANRMAIYYPTLIKDTFMYGDSYLFAWPVEEDAPGLADDQLVAAKVELTTRNPKNTRVIYDSQNERIKSYAIQRWSAPEPGFPERWRVEVFYSDRVERYASVKGGALDQESGWSEWESEDGTELAMEPHDFGEVPFFHHRTAVPYGVPVHIDGYGAQNALNKALITLITTMDSHGHPQRYGLLDKDAALDENTDDPDWADDAYEAGQNPAYPDQTNKAKKSGLQSGPGTMQVLTGMSEVGQFAAADPAVFLDPASFFIRLMAQETNTPLHYFDPSGDAPSGESLKVAEAPLVKDIEWLQLLQADAVEEEWTFVLRILGIQVKDVDVRWAAVQSATGLSDWETIEKKIDVGVPVDQALMEAGYDPEQVAKWLDADAEANTLADRVALLSEIGAAIQAMSAGIESGVVDAGQAQAAIALVLSQVQKSGQGVDPA